MSIFCFLQLLTGLNVNPIPGPVYISVSNVSDVVIPTTVLGFCATGSPWVAPISTTSPVFSVSGTSFVLVSGLDPPDVPL